ncbi:MAG: hypothetical protein J6A85_02060 [Clostridia bacterium]|nr:hypothetical protein [Clostridia bacterium]
MICTFFGHSDCYGLAEAVLFRTIEKLISEGVDEFYVGNQGHFDNMVFSCLIKLKSIYPHISFTVVLAYLPMRKAEHDPYHGYSIYPEGIEEGPQRFAIERRNKWMINHADCCLCYITHSWGRAYKFAKQAQKKGLKVICLGDAEL